MNFKKLFVLLLLSFLIFTCCGPRTDISRKYKEIERFTDMAIEASEDGTLSSEEIEMLNKQNKVIVNYRERIETKYKNDSSAMLKIEKFKNRERSKKIIDNYIEALQGLYECKGAENL